ncbi:MAG: neutral zinc metallopeptidase [Bdellovibrionota bacterium]
MLWKNQRQSENVEDRRGQTISGGGLSLGGVLIVLVISYLTGQNPLTLLSLLSDGSPSASVNPSYQSSPEQEESKAFLSAVLGSTEDVWGDIFGRMGKRYEPPRLVLFTDTVDSACGLSSAATGPFYCPSDNRLYIDMGFLAQLQQQLGAEGDFAAAYVVAHEVGHHVQTLLGITSSNRVGSLGTGEDSAQVKFELQADCFAGIWGFYAAKNGLLERGDAEEGLNAARAVGDDRIQQMSGRSVSPDSFTHGSSRERSSSFMRGFSSGSMQECDLFGNFR